jgi:pimeloyl-ACP methyl ester carboxylesterase
MQTPVASVSSGIPTEAAVQLETPTGPIHGTLLVPAGRGPHPVALLVAGSGPTDRNGNSAVLTGANNSLKFLAEALAERGIASLRYDKRGVGESRSTVPKEADLAFDAYIDDAAAWVQQLRKEPRFSTITIIGHSEGSLIGMIAAQRSRADAFVSVAGIARPAGQVIRDQLRPQLPPELWEQSERILASLEAGRTADSVPQPLYALYRPSVQPYMISWLRYTPTEEIARLSIPVLILQGTTDIQVSIAEAGALKQAAPAAQSFIIEGMNHVLKSVPSDLAQQHASYVDSALPVVAELIEHISTFVRGFSPSST